MHIVPQQYSPFQVVQLFELVPFEAGGSKEAFEALGNGGEGVLGLPSLFPVGLHWVNISHLGKGSKKKKFRT